MTYHCTQLLTNIFIVSCEHLVIDDVEGEDTDGILVGLTSSQPPEPDVLTGGHLGKHLAHRVERRVE